MCNFEYSLEIGLIYINSTAIGFLIAWKLYTATADMANFVTTKELPSEQTKTFYRRVYALIWVFSFLCWATYSILTITYQMQDEYKKISNVFFTFNLALSIMNTIQMGMLFCSLRRLYQMRKLSNHKKSSSWFGQARNFTVAFMAIRLSICVVLIISLYTYQLFGTSALFFDTINSLNFLMLVTCEFIFTVFVKTEFTLSTKVSNEGHLIIVGIDHQNREVFQLYLSKTRSSLAN